MISTSRMNKRSAAKRAILVTACALGVIGAALSAHQVIAQTTKVAAPNMPAVQSVEMAAPTATVLSSVHYQSSGISSTCGAGFCNIPFAKPGAKHQLNITRMNCILFGSAGSTFSHGEIQFYSGGIFTLRVTLPVDSSSSDGVHSINSAVDLQISGAQYMNVYLQLASGNITSVGCTATGTLNTLG